MLGSVRDALVPDARTARVVKAVAGAIDATHLFPVDVQLTVSIGSRSVFYPGERTIVLAERGRHQHLSLLHELGHFIDRYTSPPGSYSSAIARPQWRSWREAVEESEEIYRLVIDAQKTQHRDTRRAALYNLEPDEIWARCYAQYIATVSGDVRLRRELKAFSLELSRDGDFLTRQWSDESFVPIRETMDEIFEELGWR